MRDEIVVGIRNAIERGENLDQAVQTFINSGYNAFEVRAAAQLIASYASGSGTPVDIKPNSDRSQFNSQEKNLFSESRYQQSSQKNGKGVLLIGIILSLLIVFGAVGYLVYVLLIK